MRIAESVYNTSHLSVIKGSSKFNPRDPTHEDTTSSTDILLGSEAGEGTSVEESKVLDKIAEALARLGRVKRVGLSVKDKAGFVKAWIRQRRR